MSEPRDRVRALLGSSSYNGIDFVEVTAPRQLLVHFLNTVAVADPTLTATITGGDSIPTVKLAPITAADWLPGGDEDGRPLLALTALADGDFSNYTLTITAPALDLIENRTQFSFKANCPSDFDCAPVDQLCPPNPAPVPPIDYLARDFGSFRQALLEFSALRYPLWVEKSEADFGMVMAEILAAVGDELSYLQDRVAAEASLATATQRRSLVTAARLVDYEPTPATSASTILQCDVPAIGVVKAGTGVSALAPDGTPVPFEIGTGIADISNYPVSPAWNFGIPPYWFDDTELCLAAGSTAMWVAGHGYEFTAGQALLIQTDLPGQSLRQIVHLVAPGLEVADPIFEDTPGVPNPVTMLSWGPDDALSQARDLTNTRLGGNLLPATQGQRYTESFAIGVAPAAAPNASLAIARIGPNGSDARPNYVFRWPLSQTPLGWMAAGVPAQPAAPEIILRQTMPAAITWSFATTLLESLETDTHFTLDPVAWRVVARTGGGQPTQYEIDGDQGSSIRFGNDVFGLGPAEQSLFEVSYRTGLGAAGNVAADTVTAIDPAAGAIVSAARNPFPAAGGADAESAEHVRRIAPQAFQATQYRAVLARDYEAAAETLPWVQKAGTSFRWTGSWMTVFTAVDPAGSEQIAIDQHVQLVDLLNRQRLAGYESYAPPPDYISVDLQIELCAATGWLAGDVEAAVLTRLGSSTRPDFSAGFFFEDRFTFGTPLYRSRLEAAIQGVPGVAGVRAITYRKRGSFADFIDLPDVLAPAPAQILRVDNDPSWPERGTIRAVVDGGR